MISKLPTNFWLRDIIFLLCQVIAEALGHVWWLMVSYFLIFIDI